MASWVVISLRECVPVASTLQYLQRALQAPVALQEVISKGPFFSVKVKSPQVPFSNSLFTLRVLFVLKKIVRFLVFSIFYLFLHFFSSIKVIIGDLWFSAKFIVKQMP